MKLLDKLTKAFKWLLILFFGSSIFFVIIYKNVPVPCSPLMFIRCYQQVTNGESLKLKHDWVPLEDMSPDMPLAVWSSEDQNFLNHSGFDFKAITDAIKEKEAGRRTRGASTISQQTAKNVFLWPTASSGKMAWIRKGLEAYFTVLIEFFWDKQRIMEVYLNTIEMGDGIYGAEAVAQEHFGVSAYNLNRNQCALIAISLPNPRKFNSQFPSSYMYRRQNWCIRQMCWLGHFPTREEVKAQKEAEAE